MTTFKFFYPSRIEAVIGFGVRCTSPTSGFCQGGGATADRTAGQLIHTQNSGER